MSKQSIGVNHDPNKVNGETNGHTAKQLVEIKGKNDFDLGDDDSSGSVAAGLIEKCNSGEWSINGLAADPKRKLAAIGVLRSIRRWQDQRIVETFTDKPLPNIDDLNASVPRQEWELDLSGNPRPPYEHAHTVYLLNLETGERTAHISATVGTAIAVSQLKDKVTWVRVLHKNPNIVPQVELSWAPMNTRYGPRKRPDFKIIGWLDFGGSDSALPMNEPLKQLPSVELKKVNEPTLAADMNDQIPWK